MYMKGSSHIILEVLYWSWIDIEYFVVSNIINPATNSNFDPVGQVLHANLIIKYRIKKYQYIAAMFIDLIKLVSSYCNVLVLRKNPWEAKIYKKSTKKAVNRLSRHYILRFLVPNNSPRSDQCSTISFVAISWTFFFFCCIDAN